jgi:hypothetical protein
VVRHPVRAVAVAASALLSVGAAQADYAWNWFNLSNPNWDISVTDYGYSDYLLDHTPGFEGREYLSGEWGAAVGYQSQGHTVSPTWLEPRFSFPDWDTNSNFTVLQHMTDTGLTPQGLPSARSVISNGALEITQDLMFVDSVTGVAMGRVGASVGGAGSSLSSNRYVLMQSYTFRNVSGQSLDNLQYFQLLHGLHSQAGTYDNRAYGGALGEYRYDVTLGGVDQSSSGGQFDYIGFHSKVAPSAVEIGRYGIEGTDDHGTGKPSVGTHLSIEANALDNTDSFAPAERWVAGAQRFDLGTLNDGQSVKFDTALTILTGWQVSGGGGGGGGEGPDDGSANGGPDVPGGLGYRFLGNHSSGQLFAEYAREDADGVREMIAAGTFGALSFVVPGARLQLYEIEFEGSFEGLVRLTFGYDDSLLGSGMESRLHAYHWTGASWEDLGGAVDAANNRITFFTSSFSPFALGAAAVPEPGTWLMMALGLAALAGRRARGKLFPAGSGSK